MSEKISTHGIKFKDKIGYAMGDMGGLMTFGLVSAFLNMFYTDVLGISAARITVLMIVARVWDAINDPIWGAFVDSKKPTKFGRFRPYILWASFPMAVAGFLMFTKIPGLSDNQYLIYAYITYILYGMMYTGVNIPYGSLASVITDDEIERSSLSMWRSIGAGIGGLPAQILLPLVVYSTVLGADGTSAKVLDPTKLSTSVGILCLLSVVIFAVHFKLTKERVQLPPTQKQENYNVLKTMRVLVKNKPFIVLCIVSMLLICFQMYTQTVYNYLFKNYFGNPGLYSIVTICTYLPMAMFLPFMGKLIRKFGKKEICSVGLAFAAAINIIMYLMRFTPMVSNPYVFLVLVFLSGAGQTFLVLEVWALVMDVIDYQEFLSGRREEGTSYSFYSFARKLGQTIAGVGASGILGIIGYDGKLASQPPEVLTKLYDAATILPAIMLIIMFVLLAFGYKLSKKQLEVLHNDLDSMRTE
ncbi:MAG: glycoside-pentoside-hexuronide (GPH):cation symporter [Faecalibacterium sp.]|nr:glycoside-pentoside-hexuronide (GPH):cation symporter [Ruminococcus sp.]MCM1391834.1 glycoside-pentoside-hexuronide (GPH):cation symporter [Ruminococcus sp.]MCM1485698.1 glycoside-pentoside-hexuronide (GPH):cation symporter [Faecalibacterium sp.]